MQQYSICWTAMGEATVDRPKVLRVSDFRPLARRLGCSAAQTRTSLRDGIAELFIRSFRTVTLERRLAVIVSRIPVRDEGDEIACVMLAHLLKLAGYNAHEVALGTQREMLDEIAEHDGQVIYISALPPFAVSSVRRLYKRIRARFAQVPRGCLPVAVCRRR